jgi:ribonucleoside-diphosphate reductase alpha chain
MLTGDVMGGATKNRGRDPGAQDLFRPHVPARPGDAGANKAEAAAHRKRRNARFVAERVFSRAGTHPYAEKEWGLRKAEILGDKGKAVFSQENLDFPKDWSDTAVTVVASKYLRVNGPAGRRESSLKELLDRVVSALADWGLQDGYFFDAAEAEVFREEVTWLLVNQVASFNSPVWFNVGVEAEPQCSACFINRVEDTMESIFDLARTEGMLFKYGSGSGVNLSSLRSSRERLSGGGLASGPVSFMKGFDAFAGVIKSGGKTRRAAKMVILNADHPDIREFVECKAKEERKARALVELGFEGGLDGDVYSSIFFQNANNSVRLSDRFMEAVVQDSEWTTREVTSGKKADTFKATELLRLVADCAHYCGDPGIQFDDTVNSWHTCPNGGRINASNPCSEFMFLDNSACNLASLNLLKFLEADGTFAVERFKAAVDLLILAQDIVVERASYPTALIRTNSVKYRPLGLGYANLGALLMSCGMPYDSDAGRSLAGALTSLMTGEAYVMSARIARAKGTFEGHTENRGAMLQVIRKHASSMDKIDASLVEPKLLQACRQVWAAAQGEGEKVGFRNAQVTVLAPTGTIGFMMDCDTTGVEPDIALVKYKKLVGGGLMRIVNGSVPRALARLGYGAAEAEAMLRHVEARGTAEGAPGLKEEHLPVFDCALAAAEGTRSIHHRGHLLMLAAVQPFISGSISKTVNVPGETSADDIYNLFLDAWQLGLKAVAVYRDGSKGIQPLSTGKDAAAALGAPKAKRRKLPDERSAITHKFSIAGHEGYLTVGMYDDGSPGEVFIVMSKQGSTVSGLMDAFATAISLSLQHGVPLATMVDKFSHLRFEPAGFTGNPEIPMAKSVMDYIFRWLANRFLTADGHPKPGTNGNGNGTKNGHGSAAGAAHSGPQPTYHAGRAARSQVKGQEDSPSCHNCGDVMVRNGTCYKCNTCGETSGCS